MRQKVQKFSFPRWAGFLFPSSSIFHRDFLTSLCRVMYRCQADRWGVPLGGFAPVKVLTKASKERPTRGQTSRRRNHPQSGRKTNLLCSACYGYGSRSVALSIRTSSARSSRSLISSSSPRVSAHAPRECQKVPAGSQATGAMTWGCSAPAPTKPSPGERTPPPAA